MCVLRHCNLKLLFLVVHTIICRTEDIDYNLFCYTNTSWPAQGGNTTSTQPIQNLTIVKASQFSHVPPYLHFSYAAVTQLPLPFFQALKWGTSLRLHNRIAEANGFQLVNPLDHLSTWVVLINAGDDKRLPEFQNKFIQKVPFQKYNMIPGSFELDDKRHLYYHYKRLQTQHGPTEFDFMFDKYSLPEEFYKFRAEARRLGKSQSWIVKPNDGYLSKGIRNYLDWRYISRRTKDSVVQKFLSPDDQYSLTGYRYELRLFVVVTSCVPLRAYLHDFSLVKVFNRSLDLNMASGNLGMPIRRLDEAWDGKTFSSKLRTAGIGEERFKAMEDSMIDSVLKILVGTEAAVARTCVKTLFNTGGAFQIYTFDFAFTKTLIPKLIEVNKNGLLMSVLNPSLNVNLLNMATDVLNLVGYHFPPTLSMDGVKILMEHLQRNSELEFEELLFDERLYSFNLTKRDMCKRKAFEGVHRSKYLKNILGNLPPGDLRYLMIAEDELNRDNGFLRLFPTSKTYGYLKFLEQTSINSYLYKLQDAWEQRYGHNRMEGARLLRKFAWDKLHLKL